MSQSIVSLCQSFGVFWDIENCPIPNGRQASNVVNAIRHFITNRYSDCKTECTFCCACDTKKLDDRAVEGLHLLLNQSLIQSTIQSIPQSITQSIPQSITLSINSFNSYLKV